MSIVDPGSLWVGTGILILGVFWGTWIYRTTNMARGALVFVVLVGIGLSAVVAGLGNWPFPASLEWAPVIPGAAGFVIGILTGLSLPRYPAR